LGETHPSLLDGTWGLFELDLATLFDDVPERTLYEDVVTYPPVHQDLAFVVNSEVLAGSLIDAAREAVGPMLASIRVFDVYEGDQLPDGKKSIALNLSFQSNSGTLSDEDAHALRQRIVEHLEEQLGGELRA